jgi:hydrogenase expression/formation protein HypE
MAHGSGGSATSRLIEDVFYTAFGGDPLNANDSAVIDMPAGKVAFTTDAFVISPLFFPGGDIGKLAFCGTVNDLASVGARPIAITASFIIEEGVEIEELRRIADSMGEVSRKTGIPVVAGDTKVVDKGSADKVFITTSGIGVIPDGIEYHPRNIREGDKIIISGSIGDHAYCITALREGIDIQSNIKSDCAPLNKLVEALLPFGKDVRAIRDATRGGVGMVLNEWAQQSDNEILVRENDLPVKDEVRGGCALLGLDPLYLANEGKMIFAVSSGCEEAVINALRSNDAGSDATIIGEALIAPSARKRVIAETSWGTKRIIPVPRGEILPRIC